MSARVRAIYVDKTLSKDRKKKRTNVSTIDPNKLNERARVK
jgi:hypothetical protein